MGIVNSDLVEYSFYLVSEWPRIKTKPKVKFSVKAISSVTIGRILDFLCTEVGKLKS